MSETNPFEPPKAALDIPADAALEGPPPALWNPDAAGAWSLLFSPIFGSVLVWMNWKAIGDDDKTRKGAIWFCVSIVALIGTLVANIIGLAYIITWYFLWQRPQAQYVRERWGKEYPRRGWGIPLLFAFFTYIGLVVVLTIVLMATQAPKSI